VESEIESTNFLICWQFGERGRVECQVGKWLVGTGKWGLMGKGVLSQHNNWATLLNFMWNHDIGTHLPFFTSWLDYMRVWPGLIDFTSFQVLTIILHVLYVFTHKIIWFYKRIILQVKTRFWQPWHQTFPSWCRHSRTTQTQQIKHLLLPWPPCNFFSFLSSKQ
jgi:hypothetical protein